jgi:hypothetical protein
MESYDMVSFRHVYREINRESNYLSKAGLRLNKGQWQISEIIPKGIFEFFHRPFMDEDPPHN